jgi:transposase-like protein
MTDSVNLCSLIEQFGGSEEKCREYLEVLRWGGDIECPRCAHEQVTKIANRAQYYCMSCHYNFSVTAGTIFNDSHLDLWKWFLATYLICESRKGMSANQIKRTVGVSYKTAWYLCHRIRAAMKEVCPEPLTGTVEMDETYVGGKQRNWQGRGRISKEFSNKEAVFGIKQRNGELRFFHAEDCKSGTLAKYIKENVSDDVDVIMTDEFMAYPFAIDRAGHSRTKHKTIKHRDGVYVDGDITTNGIESAFSLLKRGIVGSWHKVSAKHLSAYLDEMTFRFNNRNNPYLFRDTLMKLIDAPKLWRAPFFSTTDNWSFPVLVLL